MEEASLKAQEVGCLTIMNAKQIEGDGGPKKEYDELIEELIEELKKEHQELEK